MNLPETRPEVFGCRIYTHEVLDIALLHLFSPAKLLSIHEVQLYRIFSTESNLLSHQLGVIYSAFDSHLKF